MRTRLAVLLSVPFVFGAVPVSGQARTVSGRVLSSADSQAVADVGIRVKGHATVVRSAADGSFRIQIPEQSLDMLVLTHPDYDLSEVELLGQSTVQLVVSPRVRYNQYGVAVPRTPLAPEAREGILVLESADQAYRIWFDLRAQVDGAVFSSSAPNPIGNGLEVRRARMAVKSQLSNSWYAEIDMDFADSRADVKDLYLMYFNERKGVEVRMGNFKETFSLETNTTSRYLTFLERPMVTKVLTPSRHLGTQLKYSRPYLMAAGGVHFQDVGDGDVVQARKDNNLATGANEGYSFTGKLVLIPWYHDASRGLHLGIAGSYRTPKTDDRVGTVRFDTRGPANVNRKKYLDTDRITNVHHTALRGLEAAGYYRGLRLQGEYNTATVDRNADLATENFKGGYVMGSAMLFGGRYQYNRHDAEFTQPSLGRGWGDAELALRYEYLDLNSRPNEFMKGEGEAWTVGLNWYPSANVKLMVNHSWINHDRWANGRGSLYVGRAANGTLTRDPTLVVDPAGKAGNDFRALSVRVQVSF